MVVRVPNVKSLSFFKSLSFWVFLKKNLPPFFENQIVEFLGATEVDEVATVSLGRRPRPISQLFWRVAFFNDYQETAFIQLFKHMQRRNDVNYMKKKLWRCWKVELDETRASALWEEPGQTFRLKPGLNSNRTICWNLSFHVFMNGNQVRFTPYICVHVTNRVFGLMFLDVS